MVALMGVLDMFGVAAMLPYLAVVTNPELATTNPYLSLLYNGLGIQSQLSFLVVLTPIVLGIVLISLLFKTLTMYRMIRFCHLRNHSISSRLLQGYLE